MGTSLQQRWLCGAVVLLIPLAMSACRPPQIEIVDPFTENDQEVYREGLRELLLAPCDEIPAPNYNEVHDCQRLIVPGEERFGPLVGIFPDPEAIDLPAVEFRTARVAAYITNAGGDTNYPDPGYPPLGIGPRSDDEEIPAQYCLWLQLQRDDTWRAAIVPNTEISADTVFTGLGCGEPPAEDAWELSVKRRAKEGEVRPEAYPSTARWAWSTPPSPTDTDFSPRSDGRHYIEVRCGASSCGITDRSVILPDDFPTGPLKRTVPLWHDAQHLAVFDSGAGMLVPGPWGRVTPLMSALPHGWAPGWQDAAQIQLWGDPGPYRAKFGLNDSGFTLVQMNTKMSPPIARWDNGTSPPKEVGVITGTGKGHGPHGSTRWRWHPDDEGPWMPCDDFGCCEPEDNTF